MRCKNLNTLLATPYTKTQCASSMKILSCFDLNQSQFTLLKRIWVGKKIMRFLLASHIDNKERQMLQIWPKSFFVEAQCMMRFWGVLIGCTLKS